jgi:hypothetical protein
LYNDYNTPLHNDYEIYFYNVSLLGDEFYDIGINILEKYNGTINNYKKRKNNITKIYILHLNFKNKSTKLKIKSNREIKTTYTYKYINKELFEMRTNETNQKKYNIWNNPPNG